jgi:hypothetical protein
MRKDRKASMVRILAAISAFTQPFSDNTHIVQNPYPSKTTALGTSVPKREKHPFPLVPQKHKKHTNRKHLKAKARRKRIRKGK